MESARFALAVVLMIAVIIGTNLLFPPERPEAPAGVETDTVATQLRTDGAPQAAPAPGTEAPSAVAAAPEAAPQPAAAEDTVFVESPLYRYGFSTRGGGLVVSELKEFESFADEEGRPVDLVPEGTDALLRYDLRLGDRVVDLSRVAFRAEPEGGIALAGEGTGRTLRLVGTDPATGIAVELAYTFSADEYQVGVQGRVLGDGGAARALLLRLGPSLAVHEAVPEEDYRALAFVTNSPREGIESVRLDDVDAERIVEGPLTWVALKNKYFLLAAVEAPDDEDGVPGFGGLIAEPVAGENAAALTATLPLQRDDAFTYALYLGPQEGERLKAVGYQLQDVSPYGWRVFRPIVRPVSHLVLWVVEALHDLLSLSYGAVLIVMGFLIQILLWPLQARAARAQIRNMELQPRIKEIQTRYKTKPEQMQREMMRLYKEEGFNPFGGCLPMLLPWPILITLFFVFQSTILFRGVEFLWLPDLARHDPLYILPVLLAGSMFAMQWLMMRTTPEANPQMKMMMWLMPGMMLLIFLRLASGLNLYYLSSQVASIPRQIMLNRERQKVRERTPQKK